MQLLHYMRRHRLALPELAAAITAHAGRPTSLDTVRRYTTDPTSPHARHPDREAVRAIALATHGNVTANDWQARWQARREVRKPKRRAARR